MVEEASRSVDVERLRKDLANREAELNAARAELGAASELRRVSFDQMTELFQNNNALQGDVEFQKMLVEQREATIEERDGEIAALKEQLKLARDHAADLDQQLTTANTTAELERKGREEAESFLQEAQIQSTLKDEEISTLRGTIDAYKVEVSDVEKTIEDLQERMPKLKVQAVEDFCREEGPLLRIADAFASGYYLCQAHAYDLCKDGAVDEAEKIAALEAPSEVDLPARLQAKVLEKRPDALAVLQYLRKEDPDVLAKWETGLGSPKADDDGVDQP